VKNIFIYKNYLSKGYKVKCQLRNIYIIIDERGKEFLKLFLSTKQNLVANLSLIRNISGNYAIISIIHFHLQIERYFLLKFCVIRYHNRFSTINITMTKAFTVG
jgi:hypothetical protein